MPIGRPGPGDRCGCFDRLLGADALERCVDADAVGQVAQRLRSPRRPRVSTMSVAPNSRANTLPVGVAAEGDDALGAEPLRREHGGQADGTVTDDCDGVAVLDAAAHRSVMAGRHHVRQREQ